VTVPPTLTGSDAGVPGRLRAVRTRDLTVGLGAGLVGTTAMTAGYAAERLLRRNLDGPLDYDDGTVPALAAARVLRWSDPGPRASRALGLLVHWGYGSAVGVAAVPIAARTPALPATGAYWAGITVMAGALFPLLGDTPPPWRWRRDIMVTSAVQHLLYAAVVVAVIRAARPDPDASAEPWDPPAG
jgi:hypothetical protein